MKVLDMQLQLYTCIGKPKVQVNGYCFVVMLTICSIVITVKDIFGMKRQISYILIPKVGNKNKKYDYIYNR